MPRAFITGVSGETLTLDEAAFLKSARPCGFILFGRNCISTTRSTVSSRTCAPRSDPTAFSCSSIRRAVAFSSCARRWDAPCLLPPPMRAFTSRMLSRASKRPFLAARLVAQDLLDLGINTDCAPVLDVPTFPAPTTSSRQPRLWGRSPFQIAALGRAVAEGFMAGGVLPVIKHIPGAWPRRPTITMICRS